MTDNLLIAEQGIGADIEAALIEAGWSDGYGLTDDEIRQAPSPLFYHNATPQAAASSRVIVEGVGRTIYLVYTVLSPDTRYAGNKPHHINATAALTIYTDDAYAFDKGSVHAKFLSALLAELAEREYIIRTDAEGAATAATDREPYVYRKVLYATKII